MIGRTLEHAFIVEHPGAAACARVCTLWQGFARLRLHES
jgi:hypothetical protein